MIEATELRPGTIFIDEGQILKVLKFQHHRMSQSAAVCRTKLKNLKTGAIVEKTYRPTDRLKAPEVQKRPKSFMYFQNESAHFMDLENYETVDFPKSKLGTSAEFLTENLEVEGLYVGDELLDILLPANVVLKVASAPPGLKGDGANNPNKPCILENGITVTCPLFIKEGDNIRVDTFTGDYVERVSQ